ncbi:PepSY domain-containing protein [Priestia flexa]|uniref:PepSY domain-containing protein n=1 Tax=Priestia TaxID=2800373 RepID=UPI002204F198|nr:PepSY domain-containing protein [Bacillus sp. 1780r2a1]
MKYTQLITGIAVGFASAYLYQKKKSSLSSMEALQIAKQAFKQNGPINGSWIQTTTKVINRYGLAFEGYSGGITRSVDGSREQYEFFIDKSSGNIIDLVKID